MTVTISIALLILRLGVGLTLAGHGVQKLFGWFGGAGLTRVRQSFEKQGFKPVWPWIAAGHCREKLAAASPLRWAF